MSHVPVKAKSVRLGAKADTGRQLRQIYDEVSRRKAEEDATKVIGTLSEAARQALSNPVAGLLSNLSKTFDEPTTTSRDSIPQDTSPLAGFREQLDKLNKFKKVYEALQDFVDRASNGDRSKEQKPSNPTESTSPEKDNVIDVDEVMGGIARIGESVSQEYVRYTRSNGSTKRLCP